MSFALQESKIFIVRNGNIDVSYYKKIKNDFIRWLYKMIIIRNYSYLNKIK